MDAIEEGLRFACQAGCTACCEVEGYVYLSEADVEKAARYLQVTGEEFERRYVYRTRHRVRLRKPRDGRQCHFLVEGGVRDSPRQADAVPAVSILAGTGGEPRGVEARRQTLSGHRTRSAGADWDGAGMGGGDEAGVSGDLWRGCGAGEGEVSETLWGCGFDRLHAELGIPEFR